MHVVIFFSLKCMKQRFILINYMLKKYMVSKFKQENVQEDLIKEMQGYRIMWGCMNSNARSRRKERRITGQREGASQVGPVQELDRFN